MTEATVAERPTSSMARNLPPAPGRDSAGPEGPAEKV